MLVQTCPTSRSRGQDFLNKLPRVLTTMHPLARLSSVCTTSTAIALNKTCLFFTKIFSFLVKFSGQIFEVEKKITIDNFSNKFLRKLRLSSDINFNFFANFESEKK